MLLLEIAEGDLLSVDLHNSYSGSSFVAARFSGKGTRRQQNTCD